MGNDFAFSGNAGFIGFVTFTIFMLGVFEASMYYEKIISWIFIEPTNKEKKEKREKRKRRIKMYKDRIKKLEKKNE